MPHFDAIWRHFIGHCSLPFLLFVFNSCRAQWWWIVTTVDRFFISTSVCVWLGENKFCKLFWWFLLGRRRGDDDRREFQKKMTQASEKFDLRNRRQRVDVRQVFWWFFFFLVDEEEGRKALTSPKTHSHNTLFFSFSSGLSQLLFFGERKKKKTTKVVAVWRAGWKTTNVRTYAKKKKYSVKCKYFQPGG